MLFILRMTLTTERIARPNAAFASRGTPQVYVLPICVSSSDCVSFSLHVFQETDKCRLVCNVASSFAEGFETGADGKEESLLSFTGESRIGHSLFCLGLLGESGGEKTDCRGGGNADGLSP